MILSKRRCWSGWRHVVLLLVYEWHKYIEIQDTGDFLHAVSWPWFLSPAGILWIKTISQYLPLTSMNVCVCARVCWGGGFMVCLWHSEDTRPQRRYQGSINFSGRSVITKGKCWHFGQRVILTDCLLQGVMQRANVYFRPRCLSNGRVGSGWLNPPVFV